jgi:hypothetical protein
MNEQIRLLMGQALDEKFAGTWSVMDLQDLTKFADRFAELIVQECMKVAVFKDSGYMHPADVAGYMAAGRSTAAQMIRKHFGVEE